MQHLSANNFLHLKKLKSLTYADFELTASIEIRTEIRTIASKKDKSESFYFQY